MTPTSLARRLTTGDAVVIGVGSMVGAGLFAVFAPAAAAAGSLVLVALGVAAVVALCNAASSAQLAAQYPTSGGTYVYGRERLGPWWGFVAGWGFVIGKTASCAAMALTFAAYLVPSAWQRPLAVAAVVALAAVNYRGITRTAGLTLIIVVVVLTLLAVVLATLALADVTGAAAAPGEGTVGGFPVAGTGGSGGGSGGGPGGVLQAAALLFFAFAGYARIATLGEEVQDPRRTIPRAVLGAFAVVVPLYALTAVVLLRVLGTDALASSSAPLRDAVRVSSTAATGGVGTSGTWLEPAVVVAAAMATLGALLALIAGIGRTALAMAREGDLPRALSAVHPRFAVPHVAEVSVAVVVCALVLLTDLRAVIGFSSFGVLVYYAIANASAFSQAEADRRYPRFVPVLGLVGCLGLALAVPSGSLLAGAGVIAVGILGRAAARRRWFVHTPS